MHTAEAINVPLASNYFLQHGAACKMNNGFRAKDNGICSYEQEPAGFTFTANVE